MEIIGITGKTGSGKSTVSAYLNLKLQNSLILDADSIAKDIYVENKEVINKLRFCFGKDIADCNGIVDFKALGSRVFSDCSEMKKLDEIMIPLIEKKIKEHISNNIDKADYLIIDAAILFKSNIYKYCNKIVLVKSDLGNRRKRLIDKNINLSETDLKYRLRNQKIRIIKDRVDFIIENNSTKKDLYEKLERILKNIQLY